MRLSGISKFAGIMIVILVAAFLLYQRNINGEASAPRKEELPAIDRGDDNVEKTYLDDLTGSESLAVARRAYVPGEYVFSVQAFLPQGPDYVVWLADGKGDKINIGVLEKNEDSYYLEYKSEKNLIPFDQVNITWGADYTKGLVMKGGFGSEN